MKKYILASCFFFVSTLSSHCQVESKKVDILFGEEEDNEFLIKEVLESDTSGIYVKIENVKKEWIKLVHYNNKLIKTKEANLDFKIESGDVARFDFSLFLGERWYIFYSLVSKNLPGHKLFAQSFDKKTLQFNGDPKLICEDGPGEWWDLAGPRLTLPLQLDFSNDLSKILIGIERREDYNYYILDEELSLLWKSTENWRQEDFNNKGKIVKRGFSVDNNGNVIYYWDLFPGTSYKTLLEMDQHPLKDLGPKPTSVTRLFSLMNNGTKLNEIPIEIEGKFLNSLSFWFNEDLNIIGTGFYSETDKESVLGTYYLEINSKTKEITTIKFHEFDSDFIGEETDSNELPSYKLDRIMINGDDEWIIGEHIGLDSFFGNILVVKSSSDGNIEWSKQIIKDQVIWDAKNLASFAVLRLADKIYFLFNDSPDNLNYKGVGTPKKYKIGNVNEAYSNTLLVLVELDPEGNETREVLFSSKDTKCAALIGKAYRISENEMILDLVGKKTHRWAKITFKK